MKPAPRASWRSAISLSLVFVASCATVKREVVVRVNTSGVRVYEGDRLLSSGGPPRLRLEVDRDHELRFEADGYAPERLVLESHVSGVRVLLSALQTLVLPIVVLPVLWPTWIAQGYWYVLDPEEPQVHLRRVGDAATSTSSPASPPSRSPPTRPPVPRDRPLPTTSGDASGAAPQPATATSFCGSCGAPVVKAARFCGRCGSAIAVGPR